MFQRKYPIKYIDNNLIWNNDDECFAYYELVPFNYSFLSEEEKLQIHNAFGQLIKQNRNGRIHALQLATESSLLEEQERSKKIVKGKLKELAVERIDRQTEALSEIVGNNQINYRFFIGIKLLLTEEFNLKNFLKEIVSSLQEAVNEMNHKLVGDFLKISNYEIERYMGAEKLLSSSLSRKFRMRKLNKNDIGYIIEHSYGLSDMPYEEYEYHLHTEKFKDETMVKHYDILKPTRSLVEVRERHLKITKGEKAEYSAYFTINSIVGEMEFPSSEIFYYQQDSFSFPVDTSMNIEIIENPKALSKVRNKKKELKDLGDHAWESDNDTAVSVVEALDAAEELEYKLDQTKESLYKLSYVVRVSAKSEEELKIRCTHVQNFYDNYNVKLIRPFGDQEGLHSEFIPTSKRYINDYVQYVRSDFLSALGFGATQMLGDSSGIYIGYNLHTERNVYINPALACQGVEGSVTNTMAASFTGALGGGKSLTNNLLVLYAVLFGARAVILDPKSERGDWLKHLPELTKYTNIINLTNDRENKGVLDPFILMSKLKDAESLALDILTYLTGITARDSIKFPVLRSAVRRVTESEKRGLLKVIEELRNENTEVSNNIAEHVESFCDYDIAQLLFGDGENSRSIDMDKQLNIIQVADLVLPDKDVSAENYTVTEMLSVALLLGIGTFSLDFIHSDRSIFKIVDLDEAWAFMGVAQGKSLANKLIRAGRSMQAAPYFVMQSVNDIADEKMKNYLGLKFAFRSTEEEEIRAVLRFFGLDENDEENHNCLRGLGNGQCLFMDIYGRVGVLQVDYIFPDMFKAFDTRPPQIKEIEEETE
jgi:hypothetical protein